MSLPAMGRARGAPGRVRWAAWARCWATATPATLHLQFRRRRGRRGLPLRPALPGRHWRRLQPRHAVGERLYGPRPGPIASASRPMAASTRAASTSMRWPATPIPATSSSGRSSIPGLQPRTATGSTGANQFLGQVETGYRLGIYAPASATLTPFAPAAGAQRDAERLHRSGRQSLNLNVAQQITNSLRTYVGADLAGSHWRSATRESSTWRCGWAGCTSSPTPAGRSRPPSPAHRPPLSPSTPPPRSATAPSSASRPAPPSPTPPRSTCATTATVGGGTDNHMLNVGVRFSW